MRPLHRHRGTSGFSLAELIVAGAVLTVVLLGVLNLFDFTSKVSRVQLQLAEMQQSQRLAHQELVRMARMTGRGGLASVPPLNQSENRIFTTPRSVEMAPAFELRSNAASGTRITDATSPLVATGTDILTIRGVFTTPVYIVDYFNPGTYSWDPATNSGTVSISEITADGRKQGLAPLIAARARDNEAIVLVSALNDEIYGVARLDDDASGDTVNPTTIRLVFDMTAEYNPLSAAGAFPGFQLDPSPAAPFTPAMKKVAYVGILEEYRYYVREDSRDGAPWPKLARARVLPNTQTAYAAGSLSDDLVEGVFDFQVALGYDSGVAGSFADDADNLNNDDLMLETADGATDDWLFNGSADDPTEEPWSPPAGTGVWTALNPRPRHYYLRLSSLVRTERMDRDYVAPLLTRIEDHTPAVNGDADRHYRRQLLQTLVDLRNAG